MKLRLYLTPEAHKYVAKGQECFSWHFHTQTPQDDGTFAPRAEDGYTHLADVEFDLPAPESAVHVAIAQLKKKEAEIQATAYKEVQEVQEERAKLLSLTYSNTPSEQFDDLPF